MTIDSLDGSFWLETEVAKVDRRSLLSLENPKYAKAIQKYPHLTGIQDDKIGRPVQPVAELTKLMEKKVDIASMLLTQTSAADYEQLCKLNVPGRHSNQ